ncbi:MAG: phosphotransferase [Ktedonobacteraceae bacterium]|nr:phosphotransferase [Ktedonobacteraceae bacterium]
MNAKLYPRLLEWWKDDPSDPDRPELDNPDVQRLIAEIAPGAQATDLGGVLSLNVRLEPAGVVLRVHQPFVSRQRILAVQQVRHHLDQMGLVVPIALTWRNSTVVRCGSRWAEMERYIPHRRAEPEHDSYCWLFGTLGTLHRVLATLDITVPRPLVATYAPPGSLHRWLPIAEAAIRGSSEASDITRLLRSLLRRLDAQWLPASRLPQQLVHGDVRLSNVCKTLEGKVVYLNFGFLAHRPRIHDLAYSLAFMVLALGGHQAPENFAWQSVPRLIEAYEASANAHLTAEERRALAPYTAAVPLYAAALDGFSNDPAGQIRSRLPFLRLSEWLLAHPEAMMG